MMTEEKKNYKDEMDHKSHLERLLQSDESFSVPVPDKGPLHIHIRPPAIFQYMTSTALHAISTTIRTTGTELRRPTEDHHHVNGVY